MGCKCSTRWRQKDKYGTAEINLGSSTIYPSNPGAPPPPPVPMNVGSGSWAWVRDNPSLSISSGTSLSSEEHFMSENYTGPFAVEGGCSGGGGNSCDCINTNGGQGTLIDTQPQSNENFPDSDIDPVIKQGKWVYTWSTGQSVDGPDGEENIPVKVKYTIKVKLNKYCYDHECPDGAGSSSTNDFGSVGTWTNSMEDAGNALVAAACD